MADSPGYEGSVKQGDLPARNGPGYLVLMPWGNQWVGPLPMELTDYQPGVYGFRSSNHRDMLLSSTIMHEPMWGSAVNIAISKVAAQGYKVESEVKLRAKRFQEVMRGANGGAGWRTFSQLLAFDYLMTDNGAFVEVVRSGPKQSDAIVGLNYLDSRRCIRTGRPETPVIYCDLQGREHALKWWQVVTFADMPDEARLGAGTCAATRAYSKIAYIAALERYVMEELDGNSPNSVHFITGVVGSQYEDALKYAQQSAQAKGLHRFRGKVVIPILGQPEGGLAGYEIPLRGLPSGFDATQERLDARLVYAAALGIDIQEIAPGAVGGALGSSTQSQVLDDKQRGKLLAQFGEQLMEALNMQLDASTTVAYVERDYRDQLQQAQVQKAQVDAVAAMVTPGVIDVAQARQLLVDIGVLPREFIAADLTQGESLEDDEKPLTAQGEQAAIAAQALQQQPAAPVATKEVDPLALLTDEETIERARAMMRELEEAV